MRAYPSTRTNEEKRDQARRCRESGAHGLTLARAAILRRANEIAGLRRKEATLIRCSHRAARGIKGNKAYAALDDQRVMTVCHYLTEAHSPDGVE